MIFPPLPAHHSAPIRSKHLQLLAVFGEENRDNNLMFGLHNGGLQFNLRRTTAPRGQREQDFAWAWGEEATTVISRDREWFVGVKSDGLVVTCAGEESDSTEFSVWQDGKKVRTIKGPATGVHMTQAQVLHDRLCVRTEAEEIIVIDLDRPGKKHWLTLAKFGPAPVDDEPLEIELWFGGAPGDAIVICDGKVITSYDAATGKKRWEIKAPKRRELGAVVVRADGAVAVANISAPQGQPKAARFAVLDVRTGKVLAELANQKPYARGLAFVDHGRILATASSDGSLALWDANSWKLLETLKVDRKTEFSRPHGVMAWDAHDAVVFRTTRGEAYLFGVSRDASPAAKESKQTKTRAAAAPARRHRPAKLQTERES